MRAARQGAFAGVPRGDVAQRPGTFVHRARRHASLFAHYNKDSSDNPDTAELLRVVREL